MVTDEELIDALESSLAIVPEVPDRLSHLNIPGIPIKGRETAVPHPFANNVSCAALTQENADDAIRVITSRFWEKGLPFGWVVGPRTTPSNLGEKLAKAGLTKEIEMAGLALRDLKTPFPHDESIRVIELTGSDSEYAHALTQVAAHGFEMPEDVASLFTDSYLQKSDYRIRNYLAFAPNSDEPGAFGATIYLPQNPIILLSGAATIPAQRGHGLYQALVARRLSDAQTDGKEIAIIQAVRTTSAPILKKRGFEELCNFELWVGVPPSLPK